MIGSTQPLQGVRIKVASNTLIIDALPIMGMLWDSHLMGFPSLSTFDHIKSLYGMIAILTAM